MKIWVDADACPNAVKSILFRAAERAKVSTILVANHYQRVPPSRFVSSRQVPAGFDVADHDIVASVESGDLVVTADVPLAAEVVRLGAIGLNPRGTLYTTENIHDYLSRRDLMQVLRDSGMANSTQATLGKAELQTFANQLDRYITAHHQADD